ncbi:MAG TPA: hypothetical protein VNB54_01315 [Alphaproteobacteria bacterium]|nr:hypothetical protein [Alphaproteobacteria bacterium]
MSQLAVSLMSMREALNLYFKRNGFTADAYSAPTFTIKLLGIPFTFPSTANRKKALPLHDFHHILTGYGTNWIGEAEIGAWELRAGCNSMVTYWLNGSGVVLGLFISPRRVRRAFHAARGQRTLYRATEPYAALLEMTVDSLRRKLGIPPGGLV